MFDNQRAVGLEWMNEAVAIARRPAAAQPPLWEAWQAEIDRVRQSWYGALHRDLLPMLASAGRLAAAGTAHLRYHACWAQRPSCSPPSGTAASAGEWPASIAAIDPDILPNPPIDPFSGQAFRMERRDGQLLIYSIGPNRKDEHGAYDPKPVAERRTRRRARRRLGRGPRRQPPSTDSDGAAGDGQRDRLQ